MTIEVEDAEGRGKALVAIHQPNYLPWLGFFDKLSRSDVFVILDEVQFPKGARGTWINRTQIAMNGKPRWISVPVRRSAVLNTISIGNISEI